MPILVYHLTRGTCSDGQIADLLTRSSLAYARVLASPIQRVRVFAHLHEPQHVAVAGQLVSEGGSAAPYFHFLVLEGRPLVQCQELLEAFTDLCVECLGASRELVRGGCWPIPPQYWGIGGIPASQLRSSEIAERASSSPP